MKALAIFLSVSTIILLAVIYISSTEMSDRNRVLQVEINGLRIETKKEKDSLNQVLKLKDDTIRIAKNTIILQADTLNRDRSAKENYKRNTHDKIHFIEFTNDSKRDSMLTKLYTSFRPIR